MSAYGDEVNEAIESQYRLNKNLEIPAKVSAARQPAGDIRVKVFIYWQALPMGLLRNPDFLADECKVNQCISLSESILMLDDVSVDMIAVRVESAEKAIPLPGNQQSQNAFLILRV